MSRSPLQLPYQDWPERDQAAWAKLFHEGDLLYGQGEARHWSPTTCRTKRKHYAQWLAFLVTEGALDSTGSPAERVTEAAVRAYARSLIERAAPRTVASCLIGLKCVIQRMHPESDWAWLRDITNRLDRWAEGTPGRSRRRPPSADAIWSAAVGALAGMQGSSFDSSTERLVFRDTLMIALLCVLPLRLRNLAMIRIGIHLDLSASPPRVRFDATETKTGDVIDMPIPPELVRYLQIYIAKVRPEFPGADRTDRLWLGNKAAPLAEITIYQRIRACTEALVGVQVNPHAFRTISATFLAESSSSDALHARPLLGHRAAATTASHYIRASQIEASRKVASALALVRDAEQQK